MAVTLTTSWQNVANSTWAPVTGFSVTFYLDAKYSTQSTINNNTTVQTRLNCVVNSGYGSGYNYSFGCSYAPTVSGSGSWTLENETITSGESTITHNQDGTKTITLSASAKITGIGMNLSFSGDAILPRINRYATLSTAPDFNDEANPKITFTKNVASTATVYAGIYNSSGTTAYASYRDITSSVSSGEYTFNLTTTERNAMRNAIPNAKTLQVQFKLYTTISGTNFDGGSITKTMTIVNANPTLTSATYSEQNAKVSALLGSSGTTVVQNASTIRMGITATALKGASVSKVVATHNNTPYTDTSSPYSFDIPIKTNSISLVATDSRNNTGSFSKTWSGSNYITYKPVAINTLTFKRQTETSGVILLSLDATYYQKTFGSTANAPIVKWKMGSGSWTTLTSSQYTIDTTNNKLTISSLSLGDILNYESEATFTLYIEDKLSSAQNDRFVSVGIPTLELGKDDVKVNGTFETTSNAKVNGNFECSGTLKGGTNLFENTSGQTVVIPFVGSSSTGVKQFYTTTGFDLWSKQGTTSATGRSELVLGTNKASGTAGNKNGQIRLFSNNTGSTYIVNTNTNTSTCTINVPAKNGTFGLEGVSLYDNTSGTNGTVSLSETSANFTYLEIFYKNNDGQFSSVKVYSPNNKYVSLLTTYIATNYYMMKGARIQIVADKINKLSYYEGNAYNQATWTSSANNNYIVKVLGYR